MTKKWWQFWKEQKNANTLGVLFVNRVTLRLIILARILEKHINKIQQFMLASKNM